METYWCEVHYILIVMLSFTLHYVCSLVGVVDCPLLVVLLAVYANMC